MLARVMLVFGILAILSVTMPNPAMADATSEVPVMGIVMGLILIALAIRIMVKRRYF